MSTISKTKPKKQWNPPSGFRRTINLSKGKAEIRVSHGLDTIDTKVRVFGRVYRGIDGTSSPMTVKYKVRGTKVRIKLADGTVLQARSCCKPPDQFNEYTGIAYAVRRLIKNDTVLSKDDHRLIMDSLCPRLTGANRKNQGNGTSRKVAAAARKPSEGS